MSDLSSTMSLIDLIECKICPEAFGFSFKLGIDGASVCLVSTVSWSEKETNRMELDYMYIRLNLLQSWIYRSKQSISKMRRAETSCLI